MEIRYIIKVPEKALYHWHDTGGLPVGRSFANLHIKSSGMEKSIEALRELVEREPGVLGLLSDEDQADSDAIES